MKAIFEKFQEVTLRIKTSYRGGGIEISLDYFGFPGEKMTAYQNYLGGGMLGRVCSDCTISNFRDNTDLNAVSEHLKEYFHSLTNHDDDEFEDFDFEQNQNMPVSAY